MQNKDVSDNRSLSFSKVRSSSGAVHKDNGEVNRRTFMVLLGGLALGAAQPKKISRGGEGIDYYPYLRKVIEEQCRRLGQEMQEKERSNLRFACKAVRPTNHEELSFIIAVGPKRYPCRDLVDEYARRRDGLSPKLYDHPLLALDRWAMPHTYRIPIYREQLVALIKELTDMPERDAVTLISRYMRCRADIPPLESMASPIYRENLTRKEFAELDHIIRTYGWRSTLYTWCSTMASRAEVLVGT